MVKVFEWSEVPPTVTRALLVAAYESRGQQAEAERSATLGPAAAAAQAAKTLGHKPNDKHAVLLARPLREFWVPRLTASALKSLVAALKLGVSGPAKQEDPRTRNELLDWIGARNRTENFCRLLLGEFVKAHKSDNGTVKGSAGAASKTWHGPVILQGAGAPRGFTPHEYQIAAWTKLDALAATSLTKKGQLGEPVGGLVVIPTGGGKTLTAVEWLISLTQSNPEVRFLWLADRHELVNQAARTFQRQAAAMPAEVTRTMRVIHGGGSAATLIARDDADIICATRQSIVGKDFTATKKRLKPLLAHPTVVVVDEAHHAVAPTYRQLLDHIQKTAPAVLMLGLTATPWPAGTGMTALLHKRFPTRVVDVDTTSLVASNVLARPIIHSLATDEDIWLSDAELKAATWGDLPASVLRKFDKYSRNRLIVDTWLAQKAKWGKTLVFACDIAHAETLGELFREAGVKVAVVHSMSGQSAPAALMTFRNAKSPRVLVSVDMLREGVDLPDARTAFLARPTRSPIVLRQMIGRVLRGPLAGGDSAAHIVDLRDRWRDEVEILSPLDVPNLEPKTSSDGSPGEALFPAVINQATAKPLPVDVVRAILRQYQEAHDGVPHTGAMQSTTLVGYYQLAERNVPVFAHAQPRWEALITLVLKKSSGTALEHFDDLPVPRPSRMDVAAVIAFVRGEGIAPPLIRAVSVVSPREVARELLERPAETETVRDSWLREQYEQSMAAFAYPDYAAFRSSVMAQVDHLLHGPAGTDAEAPTTGSGKLKVLDRRPSRDIQPLLVRTAIQGRVLLADEPQDYKAFLAPSELPEIRWTSKPVTSTLAYWAPRISGQNAGLPIIRVNCALRAPVTQVPDEVLCYLIWHELCHHMLAGHGHDHEFRRLEGLWPDAAKRDADLDHLCEYYDLGKSGK